MTAMESLAIAFASLGVALQANGRRLEREQTEARARVLMVGQGQSRHTRRNNLRLSRVEKRAVRKRAAEDKLLAEARLRDQAGMPGGT